MEPEANKHQHNLMCFAMLYIHNEDINNQLNNIGVIV